YLDALDAYKNSLKVAPSDSARAPRMGVINSALRVAEFDLARQEAEMLVKSNPGGPDVLSLYGDSLWASGLFEQAALRLAPRDLEIHHTVGTIFERMHKYEEAAGAFSNYVNLLPNKDHSEKADWSRAEIRFLRSFGQRVPFDTEPGTDDRLYTVDFRLVNEKVVVRAKVNDSSAQDFVVDTGSENTVISRQTAQRLGVTPVT